MKQSYMQVVFTFDDGTDKAVFDAAITQVADDLTNWDKEFVIREVIENRMFVTYLIKDGKDWEIDMMNIKGKFKSNLTFNNIDVECNCGNC